MMQTFIKKFLIIAFVFALVFLSACDKNGENSESTNAPSSEEPPVVITPTYNVKVNVIQKEYGQENGTVSDAIDRAYQCVYELKASSSSSEQLGSAVAIFKGNVSENNEEKKDAENEEMSENTVYHTYFATCLSIIEGATEYKITSSSGEVYYADFVGADPNTDIALLSVEADLPTVEFIDDTEKICLGDEMFAVGIPFNSGAGVAKFANFGAKAHLVQIGSTLRSLFILDSDLNVGYAGGAVYVKNGGLFSGIIANIDAVETDGYAFVIPSNVVLEVAKSLAQTQSSTNYGYIEGNFYLGATYDNSKLTSTQYVYVSSIDQTGCLYLGGLRELDKITRISYVPKDYTQEEVFVEVETKAQIEDFFKSLPNLKIGDTLVFKFIRGSLSSSRSIKITQYIYTPTDSEDEV